MSEINTTVGRTAMKYGLFSGLAGIAYFLLLNLTGQGLNQALSYVGFVIVAIFIFLGHKAFKDEGDGYMNYGQGLGIGVLVSLIHGVISAVFTIIYVNLIDKGYMQMIMDKSVEDMEERGMDSAQIEQSVEFMEKFMIIFMIVGAVFMTAFIGLILSLIISAITQNKRPENQVV